MDTSNTPSFILYLCTSNLWTHTISNTNGEMGVKENGSYTVPTIAVEVQGRVESIANHAYDFEICFIAISCVLSVLLKLYKVIWTQTRTGVYTNN